MEKLKNFASGLKSKLTKSDTEKLLDLAIKSNEPPVTTIFYELSNKCQNPDDVKSVIKAINEHLSPANKDQNRILRTLLLCEALCKLSSFSFLLELRQCVVKIKHFQDFSPEDKSLELAGIIRDTARTLVSLLADQPSLNAEPEKRHQDRPVVFLTSGEVKEEPVKKKFSEHKPMEDVFFSQQGPRSWYETAKVHIDDGDAYSAPQLSHQEKLLFVRGVPEEAVKKQDLFCGLKTRFDKNKSIAEEEISQKVISFDIFTQGEQRKESLDKTTEIRGKLEECKTSLFGVPMKPKFVKSTLELVEKEEIKLNQHSVSADSNRNTFDLMSLQISIGEGEKANEDKSKEFESKAEKLENSNSTLKVQKLTGDASLGYNHFGFDTEFPLIGKVEVKPESVKKFVSLEHALVDIDSLDLSLSKSVPQKRVFSTRVVKD